ncbi:hypothetical protein GY45DRAFT_1257860 [Cubamyces sp. BRFM 1775]|nr:hypothetical protein GY45DRAFT_1257860 [Cubamyces sp. BRFM 1775]
MFLISAALLFAFPGLCLTLRSQASTSSINVTIDDTLGDRSNGAQITYEPDSLWNIGQNCSACTAHPDPSLVLDGTWHDGTTEAGSDELLTATVGFNGVAIYVFCIVTRSSVSPDGNSDMTFFVDGQQAGQYEVPPDGDTTYTYNVPVFVKEELTAGPHQLRIVNGRVNGNKSLILLDYIIYRSVMPPGFIKRELKQLP